MSDIFCEFVKTDIIGDCHDKTHGSGSDKVKNTKPTIEVIGWRQQVLQPKSATSSTAGGATAGKCVHGDIEIIAWLDAATPKLLQACSAGTSIDNVIMYFYRAGTNTANTVGGQASAVDRKEYLRIEMKDVVVSSVTPSVGFAPSETSSTTPLVGEHGYPWVLVTLRYAAIQWGYTEVMPNGKVGHTGVRGAWNAANNTTSFA